MALSSSPAILIDLVDTPQPAVGRETNEDAVEVVNLAEDTSPIEADNTIGGDIEVLSVNTDLNTLSRRDRRRTAANRTGSHRQRLARSRPTISNRSEIGRSRNLVRQRVSVPVVEAQLQRSNAQHGRPPGVLNRLIRRTMNAVLGHSEVIEPVNGWHSAPTFQTILEEERDEGGGEGDNLDMGTPFPAAAVASYLTSMRNWSSAMMRDFLESYCRHIDLGVSAAMSQLVCVMVGMEIPAIEAELYESGRDFECFIDSLDQLYVAGFLYRTDHDVYTFARSLYASTASTQDLESWRSLLNQSGVCDQLYAVFSSSTRQARRNTDTDAALSAALAYSLDNWTEHRAPELDKSSLPSAPPVRDGYVGGFSSGNIDGGCVDCHSRLGVARGNDEADDRSALIYVRRCGHVYCGACMEKASLGVRIRPCKVSGCSVRGRKKFHPLFL